MATYVYRFLPVLSAIQFDPTVDVIDFSGSGVSAAEVLPFGDENDELPLFNAARTIFLQIDQPGRLGSANFTGFDDGSMVLIGDSAPTRFDDQFSQILTGGAGNDLIIGAGGSDSMVGNGGDDLFFLVSGGDDNSFWGNQSIDGGSGFDYITTDSGGDRISFDGALGGTINILFTEMKFVNDELVPIVTNVGSLKTTGVEGIEGRGGDDNLTGDASGNLLNGADGNDTLSGGLGNDRLWGGEGNDSLDGGAGDDTLRGQAGDDIAKGGVGNDTYFNVRPGDIVIEGASDGTNDKLFTATSLAVEDYDSVLGNGLNHIETIQLVGRAGMSQAEALAKIFTGNQPEYLLFINFPELRGNGTQSVPVANHLVGNENMNDLNGRGGNDTLDGAGGFDIATFDEDDVSSGITVSLQEAGATTVTNDGFGDTDTLFNIEGISGTKFNDSLTGNSFDNLLIGNWGNDTLSGGGGDDTMIGNNGADSFSGGLGNDWIAYFSTDDGVLVNLSGSAVTFTTSQYGTVTVQGGTAIDGDDTVGSTDDGIQYSIDTISGVENAVGWLTNDTLVGSSGANVLRGGAGNDLLVGLQGDDTLEGGLGRQDQVSYFSAPNAVVVNLGSIPQPIGAHPLYGDITLQGGTAWDGYDTDTVTGGVQSSVDHLSGIEVVRGSAGDDMIMGSDNEFAPTGSPRLDGSERFEGGLGNDQIDGGGATAGFYDIVSYEHASGAVAVSLADGSATGADGNDSFSHIDAIWGSAFADTLIGGSGSTNLDGNLFEFFLGGAGNDIIDGGGGLDRVDYTSSPSGVVVDLRAGTASDGFGTTDSLLNIEGVRGSANADTLIGSDFDSLSGSSGNNFFEGMGGNDSIDGGSGFDSVQYRLSASGVVVNLSSFFGSGVASNTASDGFGGIDALSGIEGVVGSDFGDIFFDAAGASNKYDGALGVRIDPNDGIGVYQDTVDYSHDNFNPIIVNLGSDDLVLGTTTVAGGTADDGLGGIDTLVNIERIVGTLEADYIRGSDTSLAYTGLLTDRTENLSGGIGNIEVNNGDDTIDGGSSSFGDFDTVNYANAQNAVIVNLDDQNHFSGEFVRFGDGSGNSGGQSIFSPYGFVGIAAGTAVDGSLGGSPQFGAAGQGIDSLINIDGVVGSSHDDLIFGGSDSRNIWGGQVEVFTPGGGSDTIVGGKGFDFVSYQGQADPVSVDLRSGTAFDGLGGIDRLSGIDGVRGSQGDDTLTGSDDQDGIHRQIFEGNAGNDRINGWDGLDIVSYRTSATGVYVNTGDGFAFDGWMDGSGHEGIDRFVEVEGAQGSDFNDTLIGGAITHGDEWEVFEGRAGNDIIDGNDALAPEDVASVTFPNEPDNDLDAAEYRNAPNAVTVNMATGAASDGYGGTDTLTGIEIAVGSSFNDTLMGGNAAHDRFEGFNGLGGNDVFAGGSGSDMVIYEDDISAVVVNLGGATTYGHESIAISDGTAFDGFGDVDTFTGIEQAIGSSFDDVIIGNDADNVLVGDDGDDTLRGGAGNDNIIGGDGNDQADYRAAGSGIVANLASGLVQDGEGGTDFLVSIEEVRGSGFDDLIIGDGAENTLHGAGGDDTLIGGGGDDWASYHSAAAGVSVDLSAGTASDDGLGGSDTLIGIKNIRGGDFNDTLTGNGKNNEFTGGLGDDLIDGRGGFDIVRYNNTSDTLAGGVTVDLEVGSVTGSRGNDTLVGIEGVVGTRFADTITGRNLSAGELEFLNGGGGNDTIIGGGGDGQTILNLSSYQNTNVQINPFDGSGRITVDAITGAFSGTIEIGNDTITFSNIDGFIGTDQFDTLLGGIGNDYFKGGTGQDVIDGGAGNDIVSYRNSPEAVAVNISNSDQTVQNYVDSTGDTIDQGILIAPGEALDGFLNDFDNGNAFTFDTLSNIETVEGGSGNDSIWGNGLANRLDGGDGNDFFSGNGGDDTLIGGAGIDRVNYFTTSTLPGSIHHIAINLNEGGFVTKFDALGNIVGNDTLQSIENIGGGVGNDTMVGTLQTYDGTQRNGGTFELFSGGQGDDSIVGGGSVDGQFDIIDYGFQSNASVTVKLADGTATGGGGSDVFSNIDMVIGSSFGDSLTGGSESRSYQGSLFEAFRGGAGVDTINGLDGEDRADFQTANAPVYVNLGSTAFTLTGTPYGTVSIGGGSAIDGTDANSGLAGVQFSRDSLTGIENVRGSIFSDVLIGGGTQNVGTLYDYEVFEGLEGNDKIDGKAGFDLASYSRSDHAVNVDLSTGKAFDGWGTIDTLVSVEGVIGSDFDDTLNGGNPGVREVFRGGAGNDIIDGGAGDNQANYNTSPNAVFVDLGAGIATDDGFGTVDTLININSVRGSIHADTLTGSGGNDSLEGMQGNDFLDGGEGFDFAEYSRSENGVEVNLTSGFAFDGAGGNDVLNSIEGVIGGSGNDTLIGNAFDNVFESGGGVDSIDGGGGVDVVTFRNAKSGVVATVATLGGSTLVGGSTILNVEGVEGSAFNDRLTGDDGANRLLGGAGVDSLIGALGDDTLDGGAGVDALTGGAGNDLYIVDAATDTAVEASGAGDDTVEASASYTLGVNLETLTLIGAANINATGNAGINRLFGNSGNNVLDGKAGADSMEGGSGNDTYVVDDAGDQTAEFGEGGVDLVQAGIHWTLGANLERLTLIGTAALEGTGNELANLIIGNAGSNVIDGRGGDDTMEGGGGNDAYFVDSMADTVVEGSGGGTDIVISVVDYTLSAEVENLTFDGSVVTIGDRTGTGNLIANVLIGAQGNDSLLGLAGSDTLDGGAGNDTLVGGEGDDTYLVDSSTDVITEVVGQGADTVRANTSYTLGAALENLVLVSGATGTGNELNNHITGNADNNALSGGDANDTLIGNAGNDTLDGGPGRDSLVGGAGDDTYYVNSGFDVINETVAGSSGIDTVFVTEDFSASAVGEVTYTLGGGLENVTVQGDGSVSVTGNAAANNLVGNGNNNVLNGGAGNDTLDGLVGADTLVGGTGNDTYTVRYNDPLADPLAPASLLAITQIVEIATGGTDSVTVAVANYRLPTNVENMTLVDNPEILVGRGNAGNNFITGNSFHNQLFGDLGNDTLDGGTDTDTLTGNKLYGGAGSDSYIFRNPNDQIIEVGGSAADKALAAVSISLAGSAGIENAAALTVEQIAALSGLSVEELLVIDPAVADIDITGNNLGNNITGNEGDNILNGGVGVDTLNGGAGSDTYVFELGLDKVTDTGGDDGIDEIQAFFTLSLAGYPTIENLTLLGTGNVNGTGNAKANVITGNSGGNMLDGGLGSDTLIGGDGNDVYVVDNGGDRVRELGTGTDEVRSTVTVSLGAASIVEATSLGNIENVTLLGTAAISATGNDLANLLVGNAGVNTLTGGLGDDTLDGGSGADRLVGGAGNDVYVINMVTDVIEETGVDAADEIRSATVLLDVNARSGIENAMLLGTAGLAIVGDGIANRLEGNAGSNNISGNAGNDTLLGNAGNDTLNGGLGDDSMAGGVGNDSYIVDSLTDAVVENSGEGTADTVTTSLSGYTLAGEVENLVLSSAGVGTGNALNNRVTGTAAADTLDGGAGNDTLLGGGGEDTYLVDTQGDVVTDTGGAADEVIASASYSIAAVAAVERLSAAAGSAAINLTGNGVLNILTGNDGANVLDGGLGADSLVGGAGADTYIVDNLGDRITETGLDLDLVQSKISLDLAVAVSAGDVENLTLIGAGNLNATGNGLANVLTGNAGNNILNGGLGADAMSGGAGADTYIVDNVGDAITESALAAGGVDTVVTSLNDYILADGLENLTFLGSEAGNGTGNAASNKLTGQATGVQNNLAGLDGNDTLTGGQFADTLDGGAGADSMVGGTGNDTYLVDSLGDKVIELAGAPAGTADEIRSSITYSIAALGNVENLTLTAATSIDGTGNAAANIITGGAGNNVLSGLGGDDVMAGGAGNDTLLGGTGNDALDGGADVDTVSYADVAAAVTVDLVAGTSSGGGGNDVFINVENVTGGSGADSLTGNAGDNVIDGGLGNDSMTGLAGNDTYVVSALGDRIFELIGEGTDTVRSLITLDLTGPVTAGQDVENLVLIGIGNLNATGNTLDNVLVGNAGNNILDGGLGLADIADYSGVSAALFFDLATSKITGAGVDTLVNIEAVIGGSGSDWVLLGESDVDLDLSTTLGLASFENIKGNATDNTLTGTTGDNILEGGAGNDTLSGGAGNDTAYYGNETSAVTVDLLAGSGTGGAGNDSLTGMENVVGSKVNDTISGNASDNVLDGGLGNDTFLEGGLGNDTYVVNSTADTIVADAGGTADTVQSTVSYTLMGELENLFLSGLAALIGIGNSAANWIVGSNAANNLQGAAGDDTLDGGAGADSLTGGADDDLYIVDNAADKVFEALGEGNDTVESSVTYLLAANVDNLVLTGTGNINATGNGDANQLTGNAGNNVLTGGLGVDTMAGGAGNDAYVVDDTAEGGLATENADEGTDFVQASVSWTLGANFENLTLTGTAANGTGNALANLLLGNAAGNVLDGGAGNDTLNGFGGNDTYHVDSIGDVLIDSGGIDNVVAHDLDWTLAAAFENLSLVSLDGHVLTGSALNNAITGSSGADTLIGLAGNDTLDGGGGADSMDGGAGADTYHYDNVGDVIVESPLATGGIDTVIVEALNSFTLATGLENLTFFATEGGATGIGNAAANRLTGWNAVANNLQGLAGNDTLVGGDGADTLDGGAGVDSMAGGAGDDVYVIDLPTDILVEGLNQGTDTVQAGATYILKLNFENLLLTGAANINGTGNADGNDITGNTGNNLLFGLAGDDTLDGGAGNDVLDGGTGADSLVGGLGDDRFVFDAAGDSATEAADQGNDTIVSSVAIGTLADNIENAQLAGTAALDITGNALANQLTGNAGVNHIDGGDGNDTIAGGAGSDTLQGGLGDDTFVFDAADTGTAAVVGGAGTDTLLVTGALPGGVLNLHPVIARYQGIEHIDITGSVGANNKLTFTLGDAQALSDTTDDLVIDGNFFDTVDSQGQNWQLQGVTGIGDEFYVVYIHTNEADAIDATLYVNQDTTQLIS